MNHDPSCPSLLDAGLPDKFGMMERASCRCDIIVRVREVERKRAHLIVDGFDMFSEDREAMHAWIDGTPPKWWKENN